MLKENKSKVKVRFDCSFILFFFLIITYIISNILSYSIFFLGRVDNVEEISSKRYTTKSTLNIKPNADDDFMEYTCQAKHKALPPDMPLRSTVQLSVLC